MSTTCVKYFWLLSVFICSSICVNAQDINWVMQPNLKGVDALLMPSSNEQSTLKLLKVKKDRHFGVVNINGEIIVPVDHEKVQIWNDGKHCSSYTNGTQRFYDNEGYEIEEDIVTEMSNKRFSKRKDERMQKLIVEFMAKNDNIEILKNENRYYVINTNTRDTIVPRWSEKSKITDKGIIFYLGSSPDFHQIAVNGDGEVLQKFNRYASIEYQDDAHIIIKDSRKYGLFDVNLNVILPLDYDRMNKIGDDKFILQKDGVCFIANSNAEPIYDIKAEYIYQSEDKKILLGRDKRVTYVFDSITNTFRKYDFGFRSVYKNQTKYIVTNKDTLKGYFDLLSQELLIPLKYRYASLIDGLFVGTNEKMKKRRINLNGPIGIKDIYNSKGDLILSDSVSNLKKIASGYYEYTSPDKIIRIMNQKGVIIKEFEAGTKVYTKHGRFIGIKKKGEKKANFYLTADFLAEKMDNSFSSIGDILSYKKSETKYIIAGNQEKYGIIDLEGNTLVPFVFENIQANSNSSEYMVVQKDGGLGIIKTPAIL